MTSKKEKIVTAINTFKLKYNCLLGDCANATDFFGTDPEGCVMTVYKTTPKTQTCNGDGNGRIAGNINCTFDGSGNPISYSVLFLEPQTIWQQLSAAGLWSGLFRGSAIQSAPYWDSTKTAKGCNVVFLNLGF